MVSSSVTRRRKGRHLDTVLVCLQIAEPERAGDRDRLRANQLTSERDT